MTALTENLVLGKEHTVDTTHKAATLTVQIGSNLLLKGGLVNVTRTNGNSKSNGSLLSLAGNILPDGVGRVDTTALLEKRSDGTAGTLGGNEDDINVRGSLDLGQILEDGGETVGEVKSLALGDEGLDVGPGLGLGSIGKQVHDNGTLLDGSVDIEKVLTGDPTVLLGGLPGSTILSNTNDDVKTVVSQVKTLAVTLGTVTNEGKSVVLEVVKELLSGPVSTLVDDLLGTSKVNGLDTAGHHGDSGSLGDRAGGSVGKSGKSTLLGGRSDGSAGSSRSKETEGSSGRHFFFIIR